MKNSLVKSLPKRERQHKKIGAKHHNKIYSVLVVMAQCIFLSSAFAAAPPADYNPRYIVAHKINQMSRVVTRRDVWDNRYSTHYPPCYGAFGGQEDHLERYFENSDYKYADGLEFDLWWNESGKNDISDGSWRDQGYVWGERVKSNSWVVSHEPCGDYHGSLERWSEKLRSLIDAYGLDGNIGDGGKLKVIYVDVKSVKLRSGNYEDPAPIKATLKEKLGPHYEKIAIIYSTANPGEASGFFREDFVKNLDHNELVGADEDGADCNSGDIAATLANRGAKHIFMGTDNSNDNTCVLSGNNTDLSGLWTLGSNDDDGSTSVVSTMDTTGTSFSIRGAKEAYDDGFKIFLMENYYEFSNGTGAYTFLKNLRKGNEAPLSVDTSIFMWKNKYFPWYEEIDPKDVATLMLGIL